MSFPEEKQAIIQILKQAGDHPHIFELGAQNGEDVEWMLEVVEDKFPCVMMVEADPENFVKLKNRQLDKRFPRAVLLYYNCAIADHNGTCDFWRGNILEGPQYEPGYGSGFGSIYQPLDGMSLKPKDFTQIDKVTCFTLDHLTRGTYSRIDLLRADIHGAEKDMIAHGQEVLKYTRYLFIEVFETPVYAGMATRSELLTMLPGWTVVKEFPWNLLLRNDNCP